MAAALLPLLSVTGGLWAEDPPAKPPRIALMIPPGIPVGQKTRVVLRGWALKDSTAVSSDRPELQISVVSHATAAVPGKQKAEQIGDEQLELDVQVPEGMAAGAAQISVRTAVGESAPRPLLIGSDVPEVSEIEPNDGFRQAQRVSFPQLIAGSIHADANVDVFMFELAQPERVKIRADAATLGSGLDPVLILWTDTGAVIQSSDDQADTKDAEITAELPAGRYLITLQDAHDRGGPAHPYRLTLRAASSAEAKNGHAF
ncbi:MAG: DVUA0089 family protein [Planctomycetota bacterium]